MKIPKKIQIGGREIEVVFDNKHCDISGGYGMADWWEGKIYLQDKTHDTERPQDFINQTFIHEVMHWILQTLNNNLKDDDTFCEQVSHLMYQVIKQIEGK